MDPQEKDRLAKVARDYGFRVSNRPRVSRSGLHEYLLTKNNSDREAIEASLRGVANFLIENGFNVRRIRLEEMLLDERGKNTVAPE